MGRYVTDGAIRAYRHIAGAQVRSQLQYRASAAVEVFGSLVFSGIDLLGVLVVFRVSHRLGGFRFSEVFLMTALAGCGFALADFAVGNIERVRVYVRTGLLDAVLARPLGALPQLLAIDFAPRRVGRVVFTLVLMAVAARSAQVSWTPARVVLVVIAPLAGAVVFGAVFVASATVAFWWIDSGEFANAVTYGGRDFTPYPMNIYSGFFRRVFAYGLGFAFVAYYPALSLLGRPDPLGAPVAIGWASPLVAVVAAAAAAGMWRHGIRHYRSTGS
jgi:ABC-2 type transport system permease protein